MPKWTKEQEQAIVESGSNIIVSAGAGSGKTAVLSERVINKLNNNIHINELLILTFTSAAAGEMKDRIRKKIAKDPALKEELNLLNSSYITTFDSYALSVVKKYHYLLNISNNISITDESIVKIKQKDIMDEIFEEKYLENDEKFEFLINKYCTKNDNNLRSLILKVSNIIDSYVDKEDFISYIENNFFLDKNLEKILEEYKQLIELKRKNVILEYRNLEYYFDSDYIEKIKNSIINILESEVEDLHLISKISLPSVPKNSTEEQKQAKEELKKSIDELLKYSIYGSIEEVKENILSTKPIVLAILDITKRYIEKLQLYKKENNIYTFNDIAFLAIKIVKEFENARNEIKYSFKEIMIDEYQDTNDIQDIFISYIENNNVYMVGDIKQSIYRFRGSNPNIFKDKYEKYSSNNGGIKIDLIKNFRSRSEVLDNINRIFELIMDYEIGGAEYKKTHEMIYGNTAYNEEKLDEFNYDIDILEYTNDTNKEYSDIEIEIFTIANDIKNKMESNLKVFDKDESKLRNITYNDFVIICDRSKYFDEFKRIFEYLEIPLEILKDENLNASIDISIIKNIVDLIIRIQTNDLGMEYKYDLLSIGRSFLYELSDEYLFNIFKNEEFKDNIIYNDFENIESIYSMTSSSLLNKILDITDFYNKIYKVGDYENINVRLKSIYEISNNLNILGYDIFDFRDYLSKIIEDGIQIKYAGFKSTSDSVKILTIHKSKGLEYPICYFADIDHKFNTKDITELFVVNKEYGLIVPSNLEETSSSILKEIFKFNYLKEEISEKIRLFYVALTRAREKMIVVLPYKETLKLEKNEDGVIEELRRIKFNKISDFIYAIKDYHIEYFKSVNIKELNLTKNYLYEKKLSSTIKESDEKLEVKENDIITSIKLQEHYSKENYAILTKENKRNMEYGTLIHEIFELIDFKNFNDTLIKDEHIRNKIINFLNNDLLKDIKNANIYHEYEFEFIENEITHHGIIDLILEYESHIDIVDFKLKNIKDEEYKKQLEGYKKYIESISNKQTNIYLYSIIDEIFLKIE